MINKRENWRGHLWQERFHSFVMDEQHLLAAVRYVELNPVRAGLCSHPEEWRWSSVHAHLCKQDDKLVTVKPMLDLISSDWKMYLNYCDSSEEVKKIRKHNSTGRPLGNVSKRGQ
jgi:putative transposase